MYLYSNCAPSERIRDHDYGCSHNPHTHFSPWRPSRPEMLLSQLIPLLLQQFHERLLAILRICPQGGLVQLFELFPSHLLPSVLHVNILFCFDGLYFLLVLLAPSSERRVSCNIVPMLSATRAEPSALHWAQKTPRIFLHFLFITPGQTVALKLASCIQVRFQVWLRLLSVPRKLPIVCRQRRRRR